MAIIVLHKKTLSKYVLLGTGLGRFKSSRPDFIGGNYFPKEEEGREEIVVVCDAEGELLFLDKTTVKVIEIDDLELSDLQEVFIVEPEILKAYNCPACGCSVTTNDIECPDCELRLR
ncbi:hypothetical protein [Fusibacter ferrireducens]|uniref:Zinc ribbon domain-containing protein n=1 Tax=Fusibacter ferrireducens TaxID=2785058 RepID=A0ABR9ZNB9_9FIRM|nr:hypothetical protein [Fusibacter ferrireducens]MBF4691963.1 hypothetical protein [Fusibacter ferrireducens]